MPIYQDTYHRVRRNARKWMLGAAVVVTGGVVVAAPWQGTQSSCTTVVSSVTNAVNAISAASGGSVVCLSNGTYGSITINATKTSPGVTLRAQNPGQVTTGAINMTGAWVTYSDMIVTGTIALSCGTKHVSILHNQISGGYYGINAGPCTNANPSIEDTLIQGNKFTGIFGEDSIRANRYHDSNDSDPYGMLVYRNEFTGNRENGNHNDCFQSVWGGDSLYYIQNYVHDNRCQGFFVANQPSAVSPLVAENNLMIRNAEPCAPGAEGCGQPYIFQIGGPTENATFTKNTVWNPEGRVAIRDPGWSNLTSTNNVFYSPWSDSPDAFTTGYTASNNIRCSTGSPGTWTSTGFTTNCSPSFPAPTLLGGDDWRLGGTVGVDWKPSDFVYGPRT